MGAIVRDALRERRREVGDDGIGGTGGGSVGGDLGVFMCGPRAMSDSVWNAIREEGGGPCCGAGGTGVAVYQEAFEL